MSPSRRVDRVRRGGVAVKRVVALLACSAIVTSTVCADSPFATRVMEYTPAPGQFARASAYNDPARALGAPVGGGLLSPDNTKVVSLGGFGGSLTLAFDRAIPNLPASAANPRGVDFIVYGNSFFVGGSSRFAMAEAATIEVAFDANGNGLADDPWFLVPGAHFAEGPWPLARTSKAWDDDMLDATNPPSSAAWVPIGRGGVWTTSAYRLPTSAFTAPVDLGEANGADAALVYGYADCAPTLTLGDTDADGVVDDPSVTPEAFYTRPGDPIVRHELGVTPGTGGGDHIDIAWAVDPLTGAPANLAAVHFVRITTAVDYVHPFLGEVSCEISGVAMVRVVSRHPCDIADDAGNPLPSPHPNGGVNEGDYNAFFMGFFSAAAWCDIADDTGVPLPTPATNSGVNEGDYNCFFMHFFD